MSVAAAAVQVGVAGLPPKPKAFLRWVGGKQLLAARLLSLLPADVFERRYYEPFLGAGSLFFALEPTSALLSDLNGHLINAYQHVRDNYSLVCRRLAEHRQRNNRGYYYSIRDAYNRSQPSASQAARFIYLNHTSYNGVFRVNTKGKYNVPFGDKPKPNFPDASRLALVSEALATSELRMTDFEEALAEVGENDFAYVDPPYPPLNGTSFFTHYTTGRFSGADQQRLANALVEVDRRGGLFLMTNADTPLIRNLYKNFTIDEMDVTRLVSCKGNRYKIGELVITNYI